MSLSKYRADHAKPAAPNGAIAWVSAWAFGPSLAEIRNCPCSDGTRRTAYITGEPDTYFSQPAAVSVQGKRAVGFIMSGEGGPVFYFMAAAREKFGLAEVALDEMTGRPATWVHVAVSYGNGNDGLSRLHPDFTLWCDPADVWAVARAAVVTSGRASARYLSKHVDVDGEGGDYGVQAVVYDPPRSPGWSHHNGAWTLCDVYPVAEVSDGSKAPEFDSPAAAFGARMWRAVQARA